MKVWIDRDYCEAELSTCLGCLNQVIRSGEADYPCIYDFEKGQSKKLTVFFKSVGPETEPWVISQALLDMVAHQFRDGAFAPKIKLEF